jgi:hypothetical protein
MINDDLASTQTKAREAAEDLQTFYRSLVSLVERLKPAWHVQLSYQPDRKNQPVSLDSLRDVFSNELNEAERIFLGRERQAGKPWVTIEQFIKSTPDPDEQVVRRNYLRLLAWRSLKGRFLEGLCLMATLSRMTPIGDPQDIDLFGQVGPIQVRDQNQTCFVWSRPLVQSQRSGLKAIPDIAITATSDRVTTTNILSLIECKCRETIGASDLRSEFGKAYDLGSPSYVLVSYYSLSETLVNAGRELGIDVQVFSLSTPERSQFIRGERDLGEDMAIKLSSARSRRMFLAALDNRVADVRRRVS